MPLTLAMKRLFPSCKRVKAAMDCSMVTSAVYPLAPCLTRLPCRRKALHQHPFREKSASVSRRRQKTRARRFCHATAPVFRRVAGAPSARRTKPAGPQEMALQTRSGAAAPAAHPLRNPRTDPSHHDGAQTFTIERMKTNERAVAIEVHLRWAATTTRAMQRTRRRAHARARIGRWQPR